MIEDFSKRSRIKRSNRSVAFASTSHVNAALNALNACICRCNNSILLPPAYRLIHTHAQTHTHYSMHIKDVDFTYNTHRKREREKKNNIKRRRPVMDRVQSVRAIGSAYIAYYIYIYVHTTLRCSLRWADKPSSTHSHTPSTFCSFFRFLRSYMHAAWALDPWPIYINL